MDVMKKTANTLAKNTTSLDNIDDMMLKSEEMRDEFTAMTHALAPTEMSSDDDLLAMLDEFEDFSTQKQPETATTTTPTSFMAKNCFNDDEAFIEHIEQKITELSLPNVPENSLPQTGRPPPSYEGSQQTSLHF